VNAARVPALAAILCLPILLALPLRVCAQAMPEIPTGTAPASAGGLLAPAPAPAGPVLPLWFVGGLQAPVVVAILPGAPGLWSSPVPVRWPVVVAGGRGTRLERLPARLIRVATR
jgi:hypothetical protein